MKSVIKIFLIILIASLTLAFSGCELFDQVKDTVVDGLEDFEEAIGSIGKYTFSNVVITQTGINSFKIDFDVKCGDDPVEIFLTEGYRLSESATAKDVTKTKNGETTRFSFTETLDLAESY